MRLCLLLCLPWLLTAQTRGVFEGGGDVGTVLHPGSAEFDRASGRYTITASGENLWGTADAFYFVWKKVSGDLTLTADISFPEAGGDPHKKAVLMMRQSLDADAAYADVATHGSGLTSLQARDAKGAATHEVQSNLTGPRRLRLVKQGDSFYMQLAAQAGEPSMAGGAMKVPLKAPFYVGIGVSAHNKDAVEKAVFANVVLEAAARANRPTDYSTLETVNVASTDRRVAYVSTHRLASPTFSADGAALLFSDDGRAMRVPLGGGTPEPSADAARSAGKEMSPDGRNVYFASDRSGRSQIWHSLADGTAAEQVTNDEGSHWLPHVSPDGTRIVFLSAATGVRPTGRKEDIELRMLTLATQATKTLAKFTGGEGTLELPCWSPDGKRVTFISYQSVR